MTVTTASIDNLNFKEAAYQNDVIVLIGKLTYVGRTSMEVRVDTYIEDTYGMRRNINRAYVVMVAIDQEGKAVEVPGLDLETEEERAEWQGGEKRYELRKQRIVSFFTIDIIQYHEKICLRKYLQADSYLTDFMILSESISHFSVIILADRFVIARQNAKILFL